jgi:copper homeostasis protein
METIKEFCADGFSNIPNAIKSGANRIELCENLKVGGVTPSNNTINDTVKYCAPKKIKIMCMLRSRGGNFIYISKEKMTMLNDYERLIKAGVDGIVTGALTSSLNLDMPFLKELTNKKTGNIEYVFHRAFDEIIVNNPSYIHKAIDELVELGFTRILTHGGSNDSNIFENVNMFNKLIGYANGRIAIMPASGVNYKNLSELSTLIKTNEFHGTQIVKL